MKALLFSCCAVLLLFPVQATKAAGILLRRTYVGQAEAFWKPVEFTSIESFPAAVIVKTGARGTGTSIPRNEIGAVIEVPELSELSIVSEGEIASIKVKRDELGKLADVCKEATNVLNQEIRVIESAIERLNSGEVLVLGVWKKRSEYEAEMTAARLRATAGAIPELSIAGRRFTSVRVTSVSSDRVRFSHDGGVSSMLLSELPEDILAKLRNANPSLFSKTEASSARRTTPVSAAADTGNARVKNVSNGKVPDKPKVVSDSLSKSSSVSSEPTTCFSLARLTGMAPWLKEEGYEVPHPAMLSGEGKAIFSARSNRHGVSLFAFGDANQLSRITCLVSLEDSTPSKPKIADQIVPSLVKLHALLERVTGQAAVAEWFTDQVLNKTKKPTLEFGTMRCHYTTGGDAHVVMVGVEIEPR